MATLTYEDMKYIKNYIKRTLIIAKSKRAKHFKQETDKLNIKSVLPYPKDFRFYSLDHLCQYGSLLNHIFYRHERKKHKGYIKDNNEAMLVSYYISLSPTREVYDKRFEDYAKN